MMKMTLSMKGVITSLSLLLLMSCGGGGGSDEPTTSVLPPSDGGFEAKGQLLKNIAESIILPSFNGFATSSESLVQAIDGYCAGVGGDDEAALLDLAKAAWAQSMNDFQKIEVMRVGPLVANNNALRDKLYSWPIVSSCAVDKDVIYYENGQLEDGSVFDIETRPPNAIGLDALEYLLFSANLNHTCSDQTPATVGWNERNELERKQARCSLAQEVAANLKNNADALVAAWNPDGMSDFINAGTANSSFATVKEAINAITDALFYIDTVLKDKKLATPLGLLTNSCDGAVCQEDLESLFAYRSKENIRANLEALQKIFLGDVEGSDINIGFDDYLNAVNGESIATTLTQDIANAIASTDNLVGNLSDGLVNSRAQVEQIHTDVKTITDRLKTDFINQLGLELPDTAAGDND